MRNETHGLRGQLSHWSALKEHDGIFEPLGLICPGLCLVKDSVWSGFDSGPGMCRITGEIGQARDHLLELSGAQCRFGGTDGEYIDWLSWHVVNEKPVKVFSKGRIHDSGAWNRNKRGRKRLYRQGMNFVLVYSQQFAGFLDSQA